MTNETEATSRPVAVYRLYDDDGALLYVGITYDTKIRFADHKANKDWWPNVTTREVRWLSNRDAAWAEEQRVIREELPRYNLASVHWVHGEHGAPPGEVLPISHFAIGTGGTIDHVVETGRPIVVTRRRVPLVVITPYGTPERAQQISKGLSGASRKKKAAEKKAE